MENTIETVKTEQLINEDFKIKTVYTEQLRDTLEAVNILVDEAALIINNEGLGLRVMDPSHVSMIALKIGLGYLDELEVLGETKLALNVKDLCKLLKKAEKTEVTTLRRIDGKTELILDGKYKTVFKILEFEGEFDYDKEPSISYNAQVKITSKDLVSALKRVLDITDHVKLRIEVEGFKILYAGDLASGEIVFNRDTETILGCFGEAEATYSISYLYDMLVKFAKLGDIVILDLASNMPIKIRPEIGRDISLTYWIAPRIEPE